MIFNTKFNPGDFVWIMRDNRPVRVQIEEVEVGAIRSHKYKTKYTMVTGTWTTDKWMYEDEVFATKEELIKSL